jgi:hypothetical protein
VRRILPSLAALALVVPLALGLTAATRAPADATSHGAQAPTVGVAGRVAHPMMLGSADLARFSQHKVTVDFVGGGGTQHHVYDGPSLLDVLQAAQPRFDPAVKNDLLRYAVVVGATDGYKAVVAWAEIDPHYAGTEVLLATVEDGAPLDRPRLVVPGDAHGGRYVSDVKSVRLIRPGN